MKKLGHHAAIFASYGEGRRSSRPRLKSLRWKRGARLDRVVPVAMEGMADEIDRLQFGFRDLMPAG